MKTTTETLEEQIPTGHWCHNGGKRCPYFHVHKPHIGENGLIQSHFCDLMEEYVVRKMCEINE